MKSAVACSPLNSIFAEFNHRPQWFQADTTVRSIQSRICQMTCAPGGTALVSRQRPHWSRIPSSLQQQQQHPPFPFPPATATFFFFPHACWNTRTDVVKSPRRTSSFSVQPGGGRTSRHATRMLVMQPPVLQADSKLCCCGGIDINWPFQRLPNGVLWSALLSV